MLDGKTKLSGLYIRTPLEATIAHQISHNIFIVAALDGVHLKMVKIRVTGITTFERMKAKYKTPSSDSKCRYQQSFSIDCFHGTDVSASGYNVVLLARKKPGMPVSMIAAINGNNKKFGNCINIAYIRLTAFIGPQIIILNHSSQTRSAKT